MRIEEFLKIMQKVSRFKTRLEQEGIPKQQQQIVLKLYIQDLTSRINVNLLEVI